VTDATGAGAPGRDPSSSPRARTRLRKAWPWIKYLGGLGLAALAVWALLGRRGELSGASGYLAHLRWPWAVLAAVVEFASIVAFALVQQVLLEAGDVSVGPAWMTNVTLAITAIANSMPAGPVVSSVFAFRQYRRRGADEGLAAWTLLATFVFASVSLAVVAAAGLAIAGAEGAGLDLVAVTVGVLLVAVALGALFVDHRALEWVVNAVVRTSRRLFHWPRGDLGARVDRIVARLTAVRLRARQVVAVMGWGLANWVLDCGCLAIAFLAVGVGVPWRGLLLAYGAGQLAVNLPITPGGLGVVEGSLTIAIVAFGGAETSTVAAVLLYRIISFWIELPVGWGMWAGLLWQARRERAPAALAEKDMAEVPA
jgi:putative heme transporter